MSSERPTPPADLPVYLTDPLERQDTDTLEAVRGYVDELLAYHRNIEAQDLEDEDLAGDDEEIVDVEETEHATTVVKKIPCGKDCSGCPHGPYKYLVSREGDSLNWEYRGPVKE